MIIKNNKIKLIYRIILVLITYIALYLNCKFMSFKIGILYSTTLSNLLVSIYFTIDVILELLKKDTNKEGLIIFKSASLICITVTMIVYNIVLTKVSSTFQGHMLECNLVHMVVPILAILDYILFDEKNRLKNKYLLYWFIPLVGYTLFVIIYIALGGTFYNGSFVPYPIIDYNKLGILRVLLNSLLVYVFYFVICCLILIVDKSIKK